MKTDHFIAGYFLVMQTQNKSKIYSIQALRALAAILVVIYHSRQSAYVFQEKYGFGGTLFFDFAPFKDIGAIGVDIFFVISGFVMSYITWNTARSYTSIGSFLIKRLIRIVPTYWFYTLLTVFIIFSGKIFLGKTDFFDVIRLSDIIYSLFFIPYHPPEGRLAPVLAVGWTLNYEIYFYVLVAIGLLFRWRIATIGLAIYFIGSVIASFFYSSSYAFWPMATNPIVLEFYYGILICILYKKFDGINRYFGCLSLIITSLILFYWFYYFPSYQYRVIFFGLPAAGIVLWFLSLENHKSFFNSSLCQSLGDSSYSLYLSHFTFLPLIGNIVGFIFSKIGIASLIYLDIYIPVIIISTIILGHILYYIIERPLNKYVSRILLK